MLASVAEQASLSLTWSETPEDTFSHDEAQMYHLCSTFLAAYLLKHHQLTSQRQVDLSSDVIMLKI